MHSDAEIRLGGGAMGSVAEEEVRITYLQLAVYSEEDYHRLPRRDRFVWDLSLRPTITSAIRVQ